MTQETSRRDGEFPVAVIPATPSRALSVQSPIKPAEETKPAAPAAPTRRLDPDSRAYVG